MERIRLSKDEKKVLRIVATGKGCPFEFPRHIYSGCVKSLERKGLVKGAYIEGGEVESARLTSVGRCYLAEYPDLRNPVNWTIVGAAGGIIGTIVAILALFISCMR